MRRCLIFVLVLLVVSISVVAQGRGNSGNKGNSQAVVSVKKTEDHVFTHEHEVIIRTWFSNPQNLKGLPPGLAKREQLPPGLQKQLMKNGKLPPGLEKKTQPFPPELEAKLPRPSGGWIRVVVGGNVLIIDVNTQKILDILTDIF